LSWSDRIDGQSAERVSTTDFSFRPGATVMEYQSINFAQKFGLFQEPWRQKVIAEMTRRQLLGVRMTLALPILSPL
jgi:hypothetical protein